MPPAPETPVTDALKHDPRGLHEGGAHWGLAWSALEWLEANVEAGWRTLEVGSGSSTIVIASRGATHDAISPDAGEHEAIGDQARALGVDLSTVTFHVGLSDEVLPRLTLEPLDLVLIDGAHGFPYPILDWWHVAPAVKVGGHVLLDDAYLPGVSPLVDFLRASPAWRLEPAVSFRTAHAVKLAAEAPPADADSRASHGRLRFSYLPPHRRVAASTRQRVFSTRAGIWVVERGRSLRLRRGGSDEDVRDGR